MAKGLVCSGCEDNHSWGSGELGVLHVIEGIVAPRFAELFFAMDDFAMGVHSAHSLLGEASFNNSLVNFQSVVSCNAARDLGNAKEDGSCFREQAFSKRSPVTR
jgi:hypothetical protein